MIAKILFVLLLSFIGSALTQPPLRGLLSDTDNFFSKIFYPSTNLVSAVPEQNIPKVKLEVYYEALCPYCQQFMGTSLAQLLSKQDLVDIVDLKLVPYGNTHQDSYGTFHCQHGVGECMSNVAMQCVLYKLTNNLNAIASGANSLTAWPFIRCLVVAQKGHPSAAEKCYVDNMASSPLKWATVIDCYEHESSIVQKAAMLATPPHDYTVWVLIDGKHLIDANALIQTVCDSYGSVNKPPSCTSSSTFLLAQKSKFNDKDKCQNNWYH